MAPVPFANVVVCSHPERVAAGGVQSCQFTVSHVPKVTFSENTVLLSLRRRGDRQEEKQDKEEVSLITGGE